MTSQPHQHVGQAVFTGLFEASEEGPMLFLGWIGLGTPPVYAELDEQLGGLVTDGQSRHLWVVVSWTASVHTRPTLQVIDVIAVHKQPSSGDITRYAVEFSKRANVPPGYVEDEPTNPICIAFPHLKMCQPK